MTAHGFYIGWGLMLPLCLFLVYGLTAFRTMESLGYPQPRTLSGWMHASFPSAALFTLWCAWPIPLFLVYLAAFLIHVLRWRRTQNAWKEKLFVINLMHIVTMSLHMTLIALCALAFDLPMGAVLAQPRLRVAAICITVCIRIGINLLLPRDGQALEVIRTQTNSAEKEPFMVFLWFCCVFMTLDSLLCQTEIHWFMLPVLLIASMMLMQFFIVRCLFHLYSIMRVRHLEDQNRALAEDLARQSLQAAALRNQRDTDALTGVYSRRYFMQHMEHLLQTGAPFSLVYIDLDRLKQINDTQGHARGDQYLVQFAQAFGAQLRDRDVFARLGGDEFAVLLPGCSQAAAQERMQAVRDRLTQEICCGHAVCFSFGVIGACAPTQETAASLLRRADQAMYRDKKRG